MDPGLFDRLGGVRVSSGDRRVIQIALFVSGFVGKNVSGCDLYFSHYTWKTEFFGMRLAARTNRQYVRVEMKIERYEKQSRNHLLLDSGKKIRPWFD